MIKALVTISLILILSMSIYSQADARLGGFRGGGFSGFGGLFGGGFSSSSGGGAKSFSSNSIPLGTGQGKMFTTSPSGKIIPQETPQQGAKQTIPSSSSSATGDNNGPQSTFQSQQPQGQFQPRSNFFGGGGFGGFGNMLMSSIMGNFIGQALFGWMFPHPASVAPSAPPHPSTQQMILPNNSSSNNSTNKK